MFDHGSEDLSLVVLCGVSICRTHSQRVAATSWLTGGDPVPIIDAKGFVAMFHIRLTCNLVRAPVRPTSQDADRPRMSLRRSLPIELFMLVLT